MDTFGYSYNIPDDKKKKSKKKKHRNTDLVSYETPYERLREGLIPGLPMMYPTNPEREGVIIPNYMVLNQLSDSGFHFGDRENFRGHYIGKSQDHDGMIIVYGGTGSGKSYSIAKPTISTWKSPIFAIDIKGELEEIAQKRRRPHKTLCLTREGGPCKLEPFYFLDRDGKENLSQNAEELAGAIIPIPANIEDSFWLDSAREVLTAAILHYFDIGMMFIETMIVINSLGFEEMINTIINGKNDIAIAFINRDVLLNPKMFSGISATFRNHIRIFATDTTIQNALSHSDDPNCELITWEDLSTQDIFIRIEQRYLKQWGRVVGMLVSQLISSLESRPDKHTPEGEKLKPVLLLLDEFPRLGKVEMIVGALEILRSKKVTIALFCQSLADLDGIYGGATSRRINDNCCFKAILNAFDPYTQKFFSSLVGTKSVIAKGMNASYSFDQRDISGVGVNLSESSQPVIHPHEFSALRHIVLLHPEGFSLINNLSHRIPGHPKDPRNRDYRYL